MTEINDTVDNTDDVDAPVELADQPRQPSAYEKKLRTEAANYRRKMLEAQTKADEAVAAVKADMEARVAEVTKQGRDRLTRAELKAHALKAGIVDLDALALLDVSKVELDDNGDVKNASDVIEAFKKAKPHFFGVASTSSTATAPKPSTASELDARQMNDADLRAFERQMGIRA